MNSGFTRIQKTYVSIETALATAKELYGSNYKSRYEYLEGWLESLCERLRREE